MMKHPTLQWHFYKVYKENNWSLIYSSLNKDMIRWALVISVTNHHVHMPASCWNQTRQQSLISHTLHFSYIQIHNGQRVNKGSWAKTKFCFMEHTRFCSTPQMHPRNFLQDKANKKLTVLFTSSKMSYGRLKEANISRKKIKLLFIITISPSGAKFLLGITLHAKPVLWW